MIPAKATPGCGQLQIPIARAQVGKQLVQKVTLVLHMAHNPGAGLRALVVPALRIHAVDAKKLHFAAIDLGRQGSDHAAVLIIEKPALGGREYDQRHAAVTKHQQLHFASQFPTVTLQIFAVHAAGILLHGICFTRRARDGQNIL